MNISIKTPNSGVVSIRPENYSNVCPIYYSADATPSQRYKARQYCNAEGWVELAEESLDPPLDPQIIAFMRSCVRWV